MLCMKLINKISIEDLVKIGILWIVVRLGDIENEGFEGI
jgi:hypothetical protein